MVRRTKEAAAETREQLLEAAERVFRKRGVTRTSLARIAATAGVTRGAVYWHFRDKVDLFDAMCARATSPMHALLDRASEDARAGALATLRTICLQALVHLATTRVRRPFSRSSSKREPSAKWSSWPIVTNANASARKRTKRFYARDCATRVARRHRRGDCGARGARLRHRVDARMGNRSSAYDLERSTFDRRAVDCGPVRPSTAKTAAIRRTP
jgi:AcrR family transcriptional regulator